MAEDKAGKGNEPVVQITKSHYRSLILDKLRAEIKAKRAQLDIVQSIPELDLSTAGYWKMAYWKMKYWKRGVELRFGEEVINPQVGVVKTKGPGPQG